MIWNHPLPLPTTQSVTDNIGWLGGGVGWHRFYVTGKCSSYPPC